MNEELQLLQLLKTNTYKLSSEQKKTISKVHTRRWYNKIKNLIT